MVAMANTAPDVNLDEVLAALDTDSREYLRALIVGAGQGLDGRDEDLGQDAGRARARSTGTSTSSRPRSRSATRT